MKIKKDKILDIFIFVFVFIVILSIILVRQVSNLDEMWNYNNARAISIGLIPYKDISLITTPLVPMISAIFLKLIVNQMIVTRVIGAVVCAAIMFIIYKILSLITQNKKISLAVLLPIGFLLQNYFIFDYNFMIIFLNLIILYIELLSIKGKSEFLINKKKDFIIRNYCWTCYMFKAKYWYNCNFYSSYV